MKLSKMPILFTSTCKGKNFFSNSNKMSEKIFFFSKFSLCLKIK